MTGLHDYNAYRPLSKVRSRLGTVLDDWKMATPGIYVISDCLRTPEWGAWWDEDEDGEEPAKWPASARFKVGMAADPLQRWSSLQTGNPEPLHFVCSGYAPEATRRAVERVVHKFLEPCALPQCGREWFALSDRVEAVIWACAEFEEDIADRDFFVCRGWDPGPELDPDNYPDMWSHVLTRSLQQCSQAAKSKSTSRPRRVSDSDGGEVEG